MNNIKTFLNAVQNGNLAQKIVFTLWILLTIIGFSGLSEGIPSEYNWYVGFIAIESIVAYVLFRVWADKKN